MEKQEQTTATTATFTVSGKDLNEVLENYNSLKAQEERKEKRQNEIYSIAKLINSLNTDDRMLALGIISVRKEEILVEQLDIATRHFYYSKDANALSEICGYINKENGTIN